MRAYRFRRGLAGLAAVVFVLPLAACADDDTAASSSDVVATPSAAAGSGRTFPVTIEQTAGDVTIPTAPTRVVALDFPSADAAIALGIVPVGMAELTYVEGGVQEWTEDALGSSAAPELFDQDDGFPFEKIAQLDPDVILATNTYPLVTENWTPLNAIAPVVAHVEAAGLDDWRDGMRKIALALGRSERGERLISETEELIEGVRERHPEFEGATASFFNYVPGDGLYVISSNDDVSMRFLRDLGFAGAPSTVTALGSAGPGGAARALISPEQYGLLEADAILGTTSGPDPGAVEQLPETALFSRVPAVGRGSFLAFGIGPATAMAFPSVLSVRWALDEIIDDLADAVRLSEDVGTQ